MANNHANLEDLFTDTADALRSVYGISSDIVADDFPEVIRHYGAISGVTDIGTIYQEYNIESSMVNRVNVTTNGDNILLTIYTVDNSGNTYTHRIRLYFNVG